MAAPGQKKKCRSRFNDVRCEKRLGHKGMHASGQYHRTSWNDRASDEAFKGVK